MSKSLEDHEIAYALTMRMEEALQTIDKTVEALRELMLAGQDCRYDLFDGLKAIDERADFASSEVAVLQGTMEQLLRLAREAKAQRDDILINLKYMDLREQAAYDRGWQDHAIHMAQQIEDSGLKAFIEAMANREATRAQIAALLKAIQSS